MQDVIPPRDEIWFRKVYADIVTNRQVTTIFRPGKRAPNDHKGFFVGETLRIRIIDKVGADWAGVFGQVCPGFEMRVRVLTVTVCLIGELTPEDFKGSTPDVLDTGFLIYHLGLLYNLSPNELNQKSVITKTTFEYL